MVLECYVRSYLEAFDRLDRDCWNYEDGCVLIGAEAMYRATGQAFYLESLRRYLDRYIGEDGAIRGFDPEEYNIDRIPSGRPLFLLHERTGLRKYRRAIERLMDQLRTHPRTGSGNLWHKKIYPRQIWLDGLYMGMPFLLEYKNRFGNGGQYDDIVLQFRNTRRFLYDKTSGLYYHAYDETKTMFWADPETGCSVSFWSRAIGWYLMALADCRERMPEGEAALRRELEDLWREALDGMLRYQDADSGLFYQLTALGDLEGNYLETSASAMVAASIFKGVRLGVLEERYRPRGEAILLGIATRKLRYAGGALRLEGMCMGAGLGPEGNPRRDGSAAYYLSEPVVSDEQKGAGVVMMALAEWLLLGQADSAGTGQGVRVEIFNGEYRFK